MSPRAVAREARLWQKHRPIAEAALQFWNDFLGLSSLDGAHEPLTREELDRLLAIVRVVSWLQSAHGTSGEPQAAIDPMQAGSPVGGWWPQLVSPPTAAQVQIVTGLGRRNCWAGELAAVAAAAPSFPAGAQVTQLKRPADGNRNPQFTPVMSYLWGIVGLVRAISESAGTPTYVCGDLSTGRLLAGAIAYDGQRTPAAEARYAQAWNDLGLTDGLPSRPAGRRALLRAAEAAVVPPAAGLVTTNPKLADVPAAIAGLPAEARNIKLTGKIKEKGGGFTHLQGLAAYKGVFFLTQSDEFELSGRLLVADRTTAVLLHEFQLPVVSTNPKYFHAGGCQVIGDILVVPCEAQDNKSVVCFFDVSDPSNIVEIPELRVFNDTRDAAAVGITNVTRDGREVWVLTVFDSGTVDVYQSPNLAGRVPFTKIFYDRIGEKNHQALPLITDASNRVFALGINRGNFPSDDDVVVYAVDFAAQTVLPFPDETSSEFEFETTGNGSLRWGTGLEIVSDSSVVMCCTSKHYTNGCHINVFDPAAPLVPRQPRRRATGAGRRPKRSARKRPRRRTSGPRRRRHQ